MAANKAPPSLGFSRQEHWSGLPFPSPMQESEKWKWSHSVVSDSLRSHGLQPTRLLCPSDFPGKSTGVGCHCLLHSLYFSFWLSGHNNFKLFLKVFFKLQGNTFALLTIFIQFYPLPWRFNGNQGLFSLGQYYYLKDQQDININNS